MESRPIKELLIILRDSLNDNSLSLGGLCILSNHLYHSKKINDKEHKFLKEYLLNNIPLTKNVIKIRMSNWNFTKPVYCYWWTEGHKEPRLKWLDKQIKKRN